MFFLFRSPSIILLTSDESPLPSGKMTMEEATWLSALLPAGALLGNFFYGLIMKSFGRKLPLLSMSIPMIVRLICCMVLQNR